MDTIVEIYQTSFNPSTKEIFSQKNITERFNEQAIGTKGIVRELENKKKALTSGGANTYYDVVGVDYSEFNHLDGLENYIPIADCQWSENVDTLNATLHSYSSDMFNLFKKDADVEALLDKSAEYTHKYLGFSGYDTHYLNKEKIETLKEVFSQYDSSKLEDFELGEFYKVGESTWKANGFNYIGDNEILFGGETIEGSGSAYSLSNLLQENDLKPFFKTSSQDTNNIEQILAEQEAEKAASKSATAGVKL